MLRFLRFGILLALGVVTLTASTLTEEPPRDVLQKFCELDAQGKQMTPSGWEEIAALFTQPKSARRDRIVVVRDFVVSRPALTIDRAEFYVEYIYLGQLDPSLLLFSRGPGQPSSPVKVRDGFYLVRTQKGSTAGQSGAAPERATATWLIQGAPPDPHLTPDAAIRYVTELRNKATDELAKKNASKTLIILKRYTKSAN
jgi:hypothetical protein